MPRGGRSLGFRRPHGDPPAGEGSHRERNAEACPPECTRAHSLRADKAVRVELPHQSYDTQESLAALSFVPRFTRRARPAR
jgi:hypothetical protein